jgi:hypothetical protein
VEIRQRAVSVFKGLFLPFEELSVTSTFPLSQVSDLSDFGSVWDTTLIQRYLKFASLRETHVALCRNKKNRREESKSVEKFVA